jgi:hypothetical protein
MDSNDVVPGATVGPTLPAAVSPTTPSGDGPIAVAKLAWALALVVAA